MERRGLFGAVRRGMGAMFREAVPTPDGGMGQWDHPDRMSALRPDFGHSRYGRTILKADIRIVRRELNLSSNMTASLLNSA